MISLQQPNWSDWAVSIGLASIEGEENDCAHSAGSPARWLSPYVTLPAQLNGLDTAVDGVWERKNPGEMREIKKTKHVTVWHQIQYKSLYLYLSFNRWHLKAEWSRSGGWANKEFLFADGIMVRQLRLDVLSDITHTHLDRVHNYQYYWTQSTQTCWTLTYTALILQLLCQHNSENSLLVCDT